VYRWSVQKEYTRVGHAEGQYAIVGERADFPEKGVPGEVVTLILGKAIDLGNPEEVLSVSPASTVSQERYRKLSPKTHVS